MVDPDSDRVSRAPPYSGYCYESVRFGYVAFTLSDAPSQKLLLQTDLLPTQCRSPTTPLTWFGLFPLRSPLLRESLLISVPELLRWFTSLSMTSVPYIFRYSDGAWHRITPFGNPRVNGYVLLTVAYRSLSRPSSSYSS